jgi:hypothetical protein
VAAKKIFPVSMSEQEKVEFQQLAKARGVPLGALIRDLLVMELERGKGVDACDCREKEWSGG